MYSMHSWEFIREEKNNFLKDEMKVQVRIPFQPDQIPRFYFDYDINIAAMVGGSLNDQV